MTSAPGRVVQLPGQRQSVGAARRFVAEAVVGCVDDDQLDTATLLVTEVVTNAVLHARTDLSVHVVAQPSGVLVLVADGSPARPLRRPHGEESVTGRGLELVEGLADDYGVLATSTGKTVWFCLGSARAPGPSGWPPPTGERSATVTVRLTSLPLTLAQRLTEHDDALLRDHELHRRSTDADVRSAARSSDATRARELLAAAVRTAGPSPEPLGAQARVVQVDLEVAPADRRAFEVLAEVLRDAEALATAGELLSRPADPELAALRDWVIGEVVTQAGGGPATPWPPPASRRTGDGTAPEPAGIDD